MKAVVYKHFKYAEYEYDRRFSYEIAFVRANGVVDNLRNVADIDDIVLVVPDLELDRARENVRLPAERIIGKSEFSERGYWGEKVLLIDEQAFYAPSQLISKAIELARSASYATWDDPDALLASFGYVDQSRFIVLPGEAISPFLKGGFDGFLDSYNRLASRKGCAKVHVTHENIYLFYANCAKFNPYPYHYAVEPTSRCNSKCIMCPFHSPDPEIAKGSVYIGDGGEDMSVETFKKIVDSVADMPWSYLPEYRQRQITAQLRGEPLLAPGFKEMCRYVKSRGLRLSFSTNGNSLDEDFIDFFLHIGLDEIIVSIDPDRESFNRIRPQLDFDRVMNNLKTLYRRRRELNLNVPVIYTKTVCLRNNASIDFINVAKRFSVTSDYVGFAYENFDDYKTGVKMYSDFFFTIPDNKRIPCLALTDVVSIHADGSVYMCYGDIHSVIGNVHENPLVAIVVGNERRRQLISANSRGELSSVPACMACTSWTSQYNRVIYEGDFEVYQNPVLSYWKKKDMKPVGFALKVLRKLKRIIRG